VVPAVVWVRRRPRRVYAAVGLTLLTPLALGPAWSPRDLVWPAVFGYLGDARWSSIYAVVAGATLLWTSTWWGTSLPWDGGVAATAVPAGSVAGLGLVTWVVVGSWLVLGWRTVLVEARSSAPRARPAAPPGGSLGPGAPAPEGPTAASADQEAVPVPASASQDPHPDATPPPDPATAPRPPVPARPWARSARGTSSSRRSVSMPK
jgi:hypothetical protein